MPRPVKLRPLPDYADLIPVREFADCVSVGFFTNDDGGGYFATATEETDIPVDCRIFFYQMRKYPQFTHVAWYNK